MTTKHRPIALIILDGFGHREEQDHNAIALANTPNWDHYKQQFTHTLISGSGTHVGLPKGQMGNSEVGHLNIGAGRMVPQELTRIDLAIEDGSFNHNAAFCDAIDHAAQNDKAIHILGLLSPGGVHSHEEHILALLKLAQDRGAKKLYLHAFLDGRDTPPQSAMASLLKVESQGCATIASITGRYYAMDRDQRWERVQQAYDVLTQGGEYHFDTAEQALIAAYTREETDEFVKPTSIRKTQMPAITIEDGDSVIFMNFRADRAREITQALTDPNFNGFERKKFPKIGHFVCLTQYHKDFQHVDIAYPPMTLKNIFAEVLANRGLKQCRIAETEKYAHVTFFLNGGVEKPFDGEDRILVPSPKVATYDLQPEMSAIEVTEKFVHAIESQKYDAIICNFANPDMVGHTGKLDATIKAVEVIDECLGKIIRALQAVGGEAIITADHGNAELMFNEVTNQPHTAHTNQPVPFLYVGRKAKVIKTNGVLADLAPTMLYLMDIDKPEEMTGKSIIEVTGE
ncbi:MAG: 2,3-bisphosphoglycerate-independent phosphoglycerate mutase [Gammaproteobacteria bacterium]